MSKTRDTELKQMLETRRGEFNPISMRSFATSARIFSRTETQPHGQATFSSKRKTISAWPRQHWRVN